MYDAPFDTPTQLGWILSVVVLAVFAARAVLVELRARARHAVSGPTRSTRVAQRALDVLCIGAVVALVVVLGFVVAAGLGR
jgi:hypothetical protein